jgi:hypothetical protein
LRLVIEKIFDGCTLNLLLTKKLQKNNTMKTFNSTNTNDATRNKTRWIVLLVLLVLSSMGVFGQNTTDQNNQLGLDKESIVEENKMIDSKNDVVSLESQIDFVGWFMGSKHNQNTTLELDVNKSSISTKKSIISSGVTPNKVLYRTFVKKVMNKDNAIA